MCVYIYKVWRISNKQKGTTTPTGAPPNDSPSTPFHTKFKRRKGIIKLYNFTSLTHPTTTKCPIRKTKYSSIL